MKKVNALQHKELLSRLLRVCFVFAAFANLSIAVVAQPLFTRTTFNDTYTAISTGSGATVSTATGNDVNQTAIPLGFTFNYAGTNYTTIGLNTNGLLWFDATAPSTTDGNSNNRLYSTLGTDQNITAWWVDMTDDASSDILYQTQGSVGSRTFTVQYTNYPHYQGSGGTNVRLNFQVILYETTNVIELRYGSMAITGAPTASEGACIGIEYGAGGPPNYIDAVTGSSAIGHMMLSPLVAWPTYNFRFTPGSPTPIAGGTYNVGIGQTYPSITLAVADLNHRGISGPVTLNLTDAQYDTTAANGSNIFPIFVGPVAGTSEVNTLTISKTGTPATLAYHGSPITSGAFANANSTTALGDEVEPILGLCASYTTISNVNLISHGTAPHKVEIGLELFEADDILGAQHNLLDKITVDLDRANTSTTGIFSNNTTAPGGSPGTNSYNIYRDITVRDCAKGILIEGVSSASGDYDHDNQIITSSCNIFNTVGDPNVANDIGAGGATYGIWIQGQSNFILRNTIIQNVSTTSSSSAIDGLLVTSSPGTCEISNNIIRNIKRNNTALSSVAILTGIRIEHANEINNYKIFNNSITGLQSSYTGVATATRAVRGLFFNDTGAGTNTFEIWNNSISIDGSSFANASNACIQFLDGQDFTIIMKNNVLANFTTAQTGVAKHYCIISSQTDRYGLSGSLSNYNNLYIANDQGTSGFVGLGNATNYATLADWQAGMSFNSGTDANSQVGNPNFVNNATDLHPTSASTSLDGTGTTPPVYITTELDCRAITTPYDIGCYWAGCWAEGGTISPTTASVCAQQTYVMSSTGYSSYPGITYQWQSATTSGGPYNNVTGGSGATTTTYTTGKLNPGTYYYVLKVTCPGGLTDYSDELTVTVNSLPAATITPAGPTTFCSGGSVVLNASGGASRSYQWIKGNANIAGATLSSYTATTGGSYKVVVTNTTTGCSKTSSVTSVTSNPLPAATIAPQGPTTFCLGDSVVLQANTGVGLTYKWKKGANYISGATLSAYTAKTQASYKVEVTNSNSCSKTSAGVQVTVPCKAEVSVMADQSISVYPNPASSVVNIDVTTDEDFRIEITNAAGEKMICEKNQRIIDIEGLASGVYLVKVISADFTITQKLVKQ